VNPSEAGAIDESRALDAGLLLQRNFVNMLLRHQYHQRAGLYLPVEIWALMGYDVGHRSLLHSGTAHNAGTGVEHVIKNREFVPLVYTQTFAVDK
jgi:hypothetical protein